MLNQITEFLSTAIGTAMPILIAAIGLVYSERSGIVNIGAEGIMLIGALAGVAGSYYTGSALLGALIAVVICGIFGLIFAVLTVTIRADQVVIGAAFNILGLGLTTTLSRIIFGVNTAPPKIDAFTNISIPVLSKIPVIGPVLFNQNIITYLIYILIPVLHYVLYKTELGLKIRAVGEHPKACDTVGINVYAIRYGTVIFSAMMCGIAGSYVSMALLSFFTENMIAGRGFIALATVVFGKYSPIGAVAASIIFGAGYALQYKLQALGSQVPFQFLLMLPYVLTLLALAGFVGKTRSPKASSVPYEKE